MTSWRRSETVMLRSIARRWLLVRLSFLNPWRWRMLVSLSTLLAYSALLVLWLMTLSPALSQGRGRTSPGPPPRGREISLLRQSCDRPVLELHSQREALGGEHFLDLVERLAPEVRRLQKLVLGALDQIADVVDVLGLEAVRGAHRELEVVHRLQQDRIDLRLRGFRALLARRLQGGEDRELVDEDGGGIAHRFLRLDDAVGLDVDHEAIEVGALLDPRALDLVAHAAHRRERGVQQDRADRARVVLAARGRRHVAAALLDLDRHVDLAALREVRDDVIGIDDLDVVRLLDVGRGHRARDRLLELERRFRAVVQLHHDALQVEDDVDDVLLHTLDGRVLVQHAGDLHLGRRVARHRGEQDASERVAQRVAVAALERLHDHLRVRGRDVLDVDDAGFQEIRGGALHSRIPLDLDYFE